MSNWGFWEWLAYGSFGLSALILAIVQGFKDMTPPNWLPSIITKITWSYVPLLLFVISALIFTAKELGWIGSVHKTVKEVQFIKWPDPYVPIKVIGKTFTNEKVIIDGYSYRDCTFNNVTFVYNGTTTIQLSNCKINGFQLTSENVAVEGAFMLMAALVKLPDNFNIKFPQGNIFERPK